MTRLHVVAYTRRHDRRARTTKIFFRGMEDGRPWRGWFVFEADAAKSICPGINYTMDGA